MGATCVRSASSSGPIKAGAQLVGSIDTSGFEFKRSRAVIDGRFVGLALDQHLQSLLTDARIDAWLDELLPLLLEVGEAPTPA